MPPARDASSAFSQGHLQQATFLLIHARSESLPGCSVCAPDITPQPAPGGIPQ